MEKSDCGVRAQPLATAGDQFCVESDETTEPRLRVSKSRDMTIGCKPCREHFDHRVQAIPERRKEMSE